MSDFQNTHYNQEDTIDIKKFIFKILRNWYWFVFTISIAVFIAYVSNRYADPVFNVRATLMIQDRDNSLSGGVESILEEQGLFRRTRRKVVENEIAILKSYSLNKRVIEELTDFHISYFSMGRIRTVERYKTNPFKVILDTSHVNIPERQIHVRILSANEYLLELNDKSDVKKKMRFGEWFQNKDYRFKLELQDIYDEEDISFNHPFFFVIRDINRLINSYRSKLNLTTTDKRSTVIELSSLGLVREKEVDYLNKIIDVFVSKGLEEKNQIALNTIYFIDEQLSDITDSLKNTENMLKEFRQENRLIDISKEGTMLYSQIDKIQTQLSMLQIRNKYYNYLSDYISKNRDFSDVMAPSIVDINDPMLTRLITELSELYKERNSYQYSSNQTNPALELVNFKITNTLASLKENITNIINNNEIAIADVKNKMLEIELDISRLPKTEKELISIQRKYKLNDDIYTYLLTKRAEAGIAKASNIPDNKILDYARSDNASQISPKKSLNYAISLIIGILIPLVIIILLDFFNDKIIERKDIEDHTKVSIIGEIGHNSKGIEMVVFDRPKSSIAESFRTLRTNIQYFNIDKKASNQVLTVTSTISGEGKSFCALNIASILALGGKKTLIIGLDLRKPKLHRELNIENYKGLSTYLVGTHELNDVIYNTVQENLYFMPAGPVPPNPAELIETEKMSSLIDLLKTEYDFIIMDTPPIAVVTDALLLSKYADLNLFIIRQNYSRKNMLRILNELYLERGLNNIGIIINDIKVRGYYGYNYYGNYGYGKYTYRLGYGYGYSYGESGGYYDDDNEISSKGSSLFAKLFRFKK